MMKQGSLGVLAPIYAKDSVFIKIYITTLDQQASFNWFQSIQATLSGIIMFIFY